MKSILWLTTLVLALAWTAGAWGLAWAVEWAASLPAAGTAPALAQWVSDWSAPPWLAFWMELDPQELQAAREFALWALEQLQHPAAAFQAALPFLVPALWVAWALGLALLVVLSVAAQWGLRRLGRMAAAARGPRPRSEGGSVPAA
ncbi:hypothetical protein [Azohydromonas caseinilytica]|uniref:Transmembrane protein n=1 Tax=Azohydromonas caseinilytica TaxID=2728836 RepID=A0A848FHP7_9BURK|nr:hypothetical protein [Azohydromonas caseinilytica]NML18375.1 hypothetical protein [Azohydromonas caseinilytica]